MVKAKKELGQNWLNDEDSLKAMVVGAEVTAADTVLEIGPGTGQLTDKLVKTRATLTLLEFDRELLPQLEKQYGDLDRVSIIEGDIRSFDLSAMPKDFKVCANIPYYLTANLLRILTDSSNKPTQVSLLVQKEVAEKIAGSKNSMLSVLVDAWYETKLGPIVEAHHFEPIPKVDSQVLVLKRKDTPSVATQDWDAFVRTLKIGYSSPRKKLRSNIAAGLNIEKSEADAVLKEAGIDINARAEQLEMDAWLKLMHKL